jgi:uncharacterized membrane-anchored protein YitT (DUF2179 family)
MNIPLTIFAYKKIGKVFAMLSITFLIANQAFGFLTTMLLENYNVSIFLFGDTTTVDQNLKQFDVKMITFYPQWFPTAPGPDGDFNKLD